MAMKLKDLLEVWEEDFIIFCTSEDGTKKEIHLNELYNIASNSVVTKIDSSHVYLGGEVAVYVKEQEKTRNSIFKESFALMHEKGVLLSEDKSYAIFTNLEDAEKELKELKRLGGRGFFIEEVNIEFKESEVTE